MIAVVAAGFVVATLLEVAGLLCVGRGIYKRWDRLRDRATAVAPDSGGVHANGHTHFGGDASAVVSDGALPSMANDPDGFASEVQRRLISLEENRQRFLDALALESRSQQARLSGALSSVADNQAQTEAEARRTERRGIPLEVWGWGLLLCGVLAGFVTNLCAL